MSQSLYLSRSFVEFGPFSAEEMKDFFNRGLLKSSDYISADATATWLHVEEWAASLNPAPAEAKPVPSSEPTSAKKASTPKAGAKPAEPAPAAKKAAAKKAPKKS